MFICKNRTSGLNACNKYINLHDEAPWGFNVFLKLLTFFVFEDKNKNSFLMVIDRL